MNLWHQFLWVIFPYLALVTFVLGHIYRYVYDQYGWIPVSSQRLERRLLMWGVLLLASGLVDGSPGQPGGRGARRWLLKETPTSSCRGWPVVPRPGKEMTSSSLSTSPARRVGS